MFFFGSKFLVWELFRSAAAFVFLFFFFFCFPFSVAAFGTQGALHGDAIAPRHRAGRALRERAGNMW